MDSLSVIGTLIGLTVDARSLFADAKQAVLSNENTLKALRFLGHNLEEPTSAYDVIYAYTLVEWGDGKPKPMVDLFRDPTIRIELRRSLEANDFTYLRTEIDTLLEVSAQGQLLKQMDVNPQTELNKFVEVFFGNIHRSRTPAELQEFNTLREVQSQVEVLDQKLGGLQALLLAWLSKNTGVSIDTSHAPIAVPYPSDPIPQEPPIFLLREDVISQYKEHLKTITWLAIVDGPGRGKTQLARAILDSGTYSQSRWLSFKSVTGKEAIEHLEKQLAQWLVDISGNIHNEIDDSQGQLVFPDILRLLTERLRNALLIIDQLPDPVDNEDLYEKLVGIGERFVGSGAKLLTTSARSIPVQYSGKLDMRFREVDSPDFSHDDIFRLLTATRPSSKVELGKLASYILAHTKGHAALVNATIQWLKQHDWKTSIDTFEKLLRGEPTESLRQTVRRKMTRLLDERHRDYFYRLSLVDVAFNIELAIQIARVPPSINTVGEVIDDLVGPWLERNSNQQFEISPLLIEVGEQNLDEDIRKNVHSVIANFHLSTGTISPSRVPNIVKHLISAGDTDRAIVLLIQLMTSVSTPEQAKSVEWVVYMYLPDVPWPSDVSLWLRVLFRTAQVRVSDFLGKPNEVLDSDLEALLLELGGSNFDALSNIFAVLGAGPLLRNLPVEKAVHRAVRAVRLLHNFSDLLFALVAEIPDSTAISSPLEIPSFPEPVEDIIWIPLFRPDGVNAIPVFLDEVQRMADDERQRTFAGPHQEGVSILLDELVITETQKNQEERDWNSVLVVLDNAVTVGELPGAEALYVAAVRAKAITYNDHLSKPEAALQVLEKAQVQTRSESFLLLYTYSRVLNANKRYREALEFCKRGLEIQGNDFLPYRIEAHKIWMLLELREGNRFNAKLVARQSYKYFRSLEQDTTWEWLEVLGELALVHWESGARKRSIATISLLGYELIRQDQDSERYKELFNKTMHTLGWMLSQTVSRASMAEQEIPDGESYHTPEPGHFIVERNQLRTYEPPLGYSNILLLTNIAALCEEFDLWRTAWKLYLYTATMPNAQEPSLLTVMRYGRMSKIAIGFSEFSLALRCSIDFLRVSSTLLNSGEPSSDNIATLKRPFTDELWYQLPPVQRAFIEQEHLRNVLGPSLLHILGHNETLDGALEQLTELENAVLACQHLLENIVYWRSILTYFRDIVLYTYHGSSKMPIVPVENEPILQVLGYWAISCQKSSTLKDSLGLHLQTFMFLNQLEAKYIKVSISALNSFLYRFWHDVAKRQRFAIRSPDLFLDKLKSIKLDHRPLTSVRLLKAIQDALGVLLPQSVTDVFQHLENNSTHSSLG